ncbi:NAD(P)-dependent oxidoreductase [Taibaiella chishuiensis]|uniref:D-3-phosphoglycerate dehydrogenase n=1 Tax=Taibaiella chishuiensis TaxID=1434707 RepID=A0A2P8DC57_9BACT|nr:NAD(P)-dependent oxidoreductase [Taibaiella chishuiensis]PSK94800.1 D-3-phosphoglycerate dehydrogenase [Taibaiella chishuiensis]
MTKRVLIAAPVHEVLTRQLESWGYVCEQVLDITGAQALEMIPAFEGVITSTRLQIDKTFIDRGTQLKWLGRMGSGMEVIDVPYATARGIQCFSSPEGNANAVAEQALGMLLGLQHRIVAAHLELQQGIYLREENRGVEIEGLTAGVIGYGNNGSAFARKLKAMDVQVLAFDKYRQGYGEPGIQECTDLEAIYRKADILSFHLPLNEETDYYFDDTFLQKMERPFVLLNLSRGKIVAAATLLAGLQSGRIKAAALDVWEQEPLARMDAATRAVFDELIRRPDFIGTPHIAGYTVQALYKMSYYLVGKLGKALGFN